jgi:hypothetical protein
MWLAKISQISLTSSPFSLPLGLFGTNTRSNNPPIWTMVLVFLSPSLAARSFPLPLSSSSHTFVVSTLKGEPPAANAKDSLRIDNLRPLGIRNGREDTNKFVCCGNIQVRTKLFVTLRRQQKVCGSSLVEYHRNSDRELAQSSRMYG